MLAPWKESYDKSKQCIEKQRHHFANKGLIVKAMVSLLVMYRCESWTAKAEHWRVDGFEQCCWWRLLRVPWTARRSNQSVHPKGKQPWIFIGRTNAEAEALIFQPPVAKNQLIGKDPYAGKDWGQEEKRVTEDEMIGWHHRLNRHEFEQPPGNSKVQGSLACCSPWGCKELAMT